MNLSKKKGKNRQSPAIQKKNFRLHFLALIVFLFSMGFVQARVYLCEDHGHTLVNYPCERIDRVLINGQWVEADCDNVNVPRGWTIDCCCG